MVPRPPAMDLVRLAVRRRTYTQSHLDYVIEVVTRVARRVAQLPGMHIVSQPRQLRHFTAQSRRCADRAGNLDGTRTFRHRAWERRNRPSRRALIGKSAPDGA